MSEKGIYGKYVISKVDGSKVDPDACYFVLRLDTDPAAQKAMGQYVRSCRKENPELAEEIETALNEIERGPCNCRSAGECIHNAFGSAIWRHGSQP